MEVLPARAIAFALVVSLAACVRGPAVDPATACRIVRDARTTLREGNARDLVDLSRGTPYAGDARSARRQLIAAQALGGIGAALLLAGLIQGFVADPATQPEVRNASYGNVAGAIGAIVAALTLVYTGQRAVERTRVNLTRWAERCE